MDEKNYIDIMWGDEKQSFILWEFCGDWDGEMYLNSLPMLWEMMDAQESLNLLVDLRFAGKKPTSQIFLLKAAIRPNSCRIDKVVITPRDAYWNGIYQLACRMIPAITKINVQFVETLEEAQTILAQNSGTAGG